MIRWLKDGVGDPSEQEVELYPEHQLRVTKSGQVAVDLGSREIHEIIRDDWHRRKKDGTRDELMREIRRRMQPIRSVDLDVKVVEETPEVSLITQEIRFETEGGLEIGGVLLAPRNEGRKPAVLVVETGEAPSALARQLAKKGNVVLALNPRGLPASERTSQRRLVGDWMPNTRAWFIGGNMPGMRAHDIRRGVDFLAERDDVAAGSIRAVAREVAGVWLLMAAADDPRIAKIWLDGTPHSLRAAFDNPLHRDLHDAIIPGFALHWDLDDLTDALDGRSVLWTDPTDWMGHTVKLEGDYRYRVMLEPDDALVEEFLR
jgi:hypothetical protein